MTGNGRNPMPELTVMMVPAPRPIRCGVKASMTRMVPRRLVSIVFCAALKCAGSRRSSGIPIPDVVTIVSRPGGLRRIVSRARSMLAASVTSMGTVANPSAASLPSRSARRPPTMTSLPGGWQEWAGPRAADDDVAAGRGEAASELEADPRGSAGDEDGAVGDVHCLLLLRAPDSDELAGAVDDGSGYRPGASMRGCARVIRRHLQCWLVLRPQAVPPSSGVPSGPPQPRRP